MPLFQLNNLYQGVYKKKEQKTVIEQKNLFTISILPDKNFQLVFIIDNGELLHYAKVHGTFTGKEKRKKKEKKTCEMECCMGQLFSTKIVQIWVDHDTGIQPLTVFTN